MIIESVTDTKIPFLIIRDLYNENELNGIYLELEFLSRSGAFDEDASKTKAAIDYTGARKKKAKGVFLDEVYTNRNHSLILKANRKPFSHTKIVNAFVELDQFRYHTYRDGDNDSTLINYYENSDYYREHSDASHFSLVTWFFREPKKFTGGNLRFVDLNKTVEIENNMCVIFPGYLKHEVEEISLNVDESNLINGRFSMAQFLDFKS